MLYQTDPRVNVQVVLLTW